ncbi:glycoside hydrolase family 43 protein [Rhizomonospora bruguierae]|uniref:glycoside hydrolase family 43 protein n=1 Tax=Rhizomonospora bruguierae TaxID=1581705 RepID=UPI001BCF38EC|nr:glycoside hydrolase family 43 protein [Micromonospora sp. NBRC 107566]
MNGPVLPGFHPDPSVCRVGDDYYLVCSSFEYFPGVPIFHSRNLTTWRQIGNVLDRPSQLPLERASPSGGIWAPTIRYHDGRFWMITTNSGRGFIVTGERPEGPWSEPVPIDLPGVDPDLAWDEDGTCWCTFSGIQQARIDPLRGKVLEGPWPVWSGGGLAHPEAPHLYRVDGWWYLMIAEGGTGHGHCVSIARSRSPRGPFEPGPANPIVSHRSTTSPIQSTGHADLVQAVDGAWWMVLLGTRPRGHFPGFHVLGRETFLAPVTWVDGWPVVGDVGATTTAAGGSSAACGPAATTAAGASSGARVPTTATGGGCRDDFDAPALAPEWISPRSRPDGSWALDARPGWLRLHATGSSLDRPGHTFVGRRQQHADCRVSARLDPGGGRAGLSIRLDEAHHYDLEVAGGRASVIARIGPLRQVVAGRAVPPGPVELVVRIRTADVLPPAVTAADQVTAGPLGLAPGPDTIGFHLRSAGVTDDGRPLAELDGRYLSTEVAGGFTGRVIGVYVTEGHADFDWFDIRPTGVDSE